MGSDDIDVVLMGRLSYGWIESGVDFKIWARIDGLGVLFGL